MTDESSDTDDIPENTHRQEIVLEQWKVYSNSAHNVSERRLKNNRFYLRLLVALLGIASIGTELEVLTPAIVLFIGIIGIPFCVIWGFHILSYKQLNSGKYRVMWTIAEQLPFDPFKMEWERLHEGKKASVYIPHTTVEVWWPRIFGLFYAVVALWGFLEVTENGDLFIKGTFILATIWIIYGLLVIFRKSPVQYWWDYTGEDD